MKKTILNLMILLLLTACKSNYNGELLFIEPGEGDAFHFPYFLFIPDQVSTGQGSFIVVEPNNSGFADDDLQKHIEKAERIASMDFYPGNYVAQHLHYPLIVPVFPRPKTQWKIYTHALDRDVMIQKDNPLERIDEQLLGMFDDALPFDDAFDQNERDVIYELLGKEMLPLRWESCESIYLNEGVNAQIKTYANLGHECPDKVKEEILAFFQSKINKGLSAPK
jgi:hypothetical protein